MICETVHQSIMHCHFDNLVSCYFILPIVPVKSRQESTLSILSVDRKPCQRNCCHCLVGHANNTITYNTTSNTTTTTTTTNNNSNNSPSPQPQPQPPAPLPPPPPPPISATTLNRHINSHLQQKQQRHSSITITTTTTTNNSNNTPLPPPPITITITRTQTGIFSPISGIAVIHRMYKQHYHEEPLLRYQ